MNSLEDVIKSIENKLLSIEGMNEDKLETFIYLMMKYKKGSIIYFEVLKRKLGLPLEKCNIILDLLDRKLNILDKKYGVMCRNCGANISEIYDSVGEIPKYSDCVNCDGEIDSQNNIRVVYIMK